MANPFTSTVAPKIPQPTNRLLAGTASGILRQPCLARINFQFGSLKVNGSNFARVADAIDSGRIKCWTVKEFESQGADELAPGMIVNAQYQIKPNAILFSSEDFGRNPGEDRTIVHEAVHAAFDLDAPLGKKTPTLSIEDESAAVVAVAFYIRLCKKEVGGFLMDAEGPEKAALALVDSVADRSGPFPTWPGPYIFTQQDTQAIRTGTATKWHFDQFIASDGRWTDNSGAKYVYDGVPACSRRNVCK